MKAPMVVDVGAPLGRRGGRSGLWQLREMKGFEPAVRTVA